MIKHKFLTLLVALCATTALWASNVITYTATEKLTRSTLNVGETTFGSRIISHTFSNRTGTITCDGEVTTIGDYAFYHCSGMTSLTIPNSVTTIGEGAFADCHSLTSVTIPNSVTTIEEQAFYYCTGLTSINVDAANTHYASVDGVLFNYAKDTLIQYPIGNRAEYIIPNSVTTIGNSAFAYCSGLTSVSIPNSVTTIGNSAFAYCSGLTSVSIPNSVTTIGSYAFRECYGLTSVAIPNSVTTIGSSAFFGCLSLPVVDNIRYADTYLVEAVDKTLSSYVIKEGTKWIGNRAFEYCYGLTSVTIPNSVTTIGDYAFNWCYGLTKTNYTGTIADWCKIKFSSFDSNPISCSHNFFINDVEVKDLVIPEGVDTIGNYAFEDCSSLTSVTIPHSVTTIGNYAFFYCSGLTSITIPNSVTTIGSYAFDGCYGLTSVAIPNSVTTIGKYAFGWCSGLTSVTIGNSVKEIGDNAFYECSGLTSVTIPNSVTTIGDDAFADVNNIIYNGTAIGSPWGAKCVNGYVDGYLVYSDATKTTLCGCSSAATGEVAIPNSVTTIGIAAFADCYGLTSITIPNSVTTIGDYAFFYCSGLTSITIPNSVTTIGSYAFDGCSGLTSVTIGNSVTTIGEDAFRGCDGLTSITIPNSVTTIGEDAFRGCDGLTSVTCEATTPPTCGDNCFYEVDTSIPLYVPAGSVDAYKAADQWKDFTDIRPIATAKDVEVTEIEAEPTESAVEIAWPSVVNAETYTIEIRLNDKLICSIVFNAEGQLVSINFNFAPGRGGHTYATTAENTATGWAYTIAGLNPGTKYTYSVIAKNADGQVIDTKSGVFSTQGLPTSIDNMGNNFNNSYVNPTKSLRNGQVLIRKDGKTYNTLGQEVK